ncbi:MAG: hypothetical protein ACRDQU_15765 [Pseudonocardiaceae bacterium]
MTLPVRRGRYPTRRWDPLAGLPAADLEHGVLRLRLPKASSGVRQRIPVQTRRTEPDSGKAADTAESTTSKKKLTHD